MAVDTQGDWAVRAAAAGDASAWRSLIERHSGRVYGLIYRQCGDRELAEEICQATFVRVLDKLDAYQEQGKLEPWLCRIAMNLFRDEMRRRKRQAVPTDFASTPPEVLGASGGADGPSAGLEAAERAEQLRAAVARLPEADRELLHLRYTADLSYQQIAEVLDQPLGTVLARGHRALKKLKALLESTEQAA